MKKVHLARPALFAAFIIAATLGFSDRVLADANSELVSDNFRESPDAASLEKQFEGLAAQVGPTVVSIGSPVIQEVPQGNAPSGTGASASKVSTGRELIALLDKKVRMVGSGVIFDSAGYILTNQHVLQDSQEHWVTLDNGTVYPASVVGTDPRADLAILKISADRNLPVARFAQGGDFRRGQWTVSMGNPYGLAQEGDLNLAVGVISSTHRNLSISGSKNRLYTELLQHTCQIYPGNSGGPLFDIQGNVIGINTAVILPGSPNTYGMGFAIPVGERIFRSMKYMQTGAEVPYSRIGVTLSDLPEGASGPRGVRISFIEPNAPAAQAGLKVGDLITRLEGTPALNSNELILRITGRDPGTWVTFSVLRGGRPMDVNVRTDHWVPGSDN